MSRGAILRYSENDEARLICQLEGQDLAGFSFLARLRREDEALIERVGSLESVGSDRFFFDWLDGDLAPGCHQLEIVITDAGGNDRSYPSDATITVKVRARV